MNVMDWATFNSIDWVTVLGYENLPGRPTPQAALRA
jgi:hypothetical protein